MWSVVLTDSAGVVLAQAPGAEITDVDIPLSDTESWSVTFPAGSEAAAVILATDPLPEVECMVRRSGRVVAWGPCLSFAVGRDGHVSVECRGAVHHLDRTLIGPPQLANEFLDPEFANGLDDWDAWRTDLIISGPWAFPTFVDVDGAIDIVSGGGSVPYPPRGGLPIVRFKGDTLDPTEGLQIAQDFTVTPSVYRDFEVTCRGAFYVPAATPFVRTNIDGAIYLSAHDPTGSFPDAYFAPSLIEVSGWPEIPVQGAWHDIELSLRLPAGSGPWLVHAAFSPPLMLTYMTMPELTFDDAVEVVNSTAPEVVTTLVEHGQDTDYGHLDRNISTDVTPGGPRVDRFYRHAEHQSVGGALRELADQGLVEWRVDYTHTDRTIVAAPTIGTDAGVVEVADGHLSGVRLASWERAWSRGSDVVICQQSATRAEIAAGAGTLAWEEVLPAPDHVPRWYLADWAEAKVLETSTPEVLALEWPAGSVWATGSALVGDELEVSVDVHGVTVDGVWRVVAVTLDPISDRAVVQLSPVGSGS
jgi:hypothetical protein